MILLYLNAQVTLIILRLCGVIHWSWWDTLGLITYPLTLLVIGGIGGVIGALIGERYLIPFLNKLFPIDKRAKV